MGARVREEGLPEVSQHILDVAAVHFAEKGFAGARVDEISAEAGISKSSIYYRLGDKEALYHAVLNHMINSILQVTEEKMDGRVDAKEKLDLYIRTTAGFVLSNPHFSPIIMRELASGGVNMSTETLNVMSRMKHYLFEILQVGAEQQCFREVDASIVHLIIAGTVNFFAVTTPIRDRLQQLEGEHPCQSLMAETENDEVIIQQISDFILRAVQR